MHREELLNRPLYHATSTLFLPSIIENGLGGINQLEQYNILPFMEKLYKKASKAGCFVGNEVFQLNCKYIIEQHVGCCNFRHGGTYLSSSKNKAANFLRNRYGSELLTNAVDLYEWLESSNQSLINEDPDIINSPIHKLRVDTYQPVLIEVSEVAKSCLRTETGKQVKWEYCESLMDFPGVNFELVGSVSKENLVITINPELDLVGF